MEPDEEITQEEEYTSKYSDEQREQFFKAFLANKPFEQEEKLFNDQVVIKFRTLTVGESTDVFNQLKADQTNLKLLTDATYMMTLTNFRLGLAIMEINGETFQPKITKELFKGDEDNSYVSERAKIFTDWPLFKLSAIAEAFKVFEDTVIDLTMEIQKPNFWKADKQSS